MFGDLSISDCGDRKSRSWVSNTDYMGTLARWKAKGETGLTAKEPNAFSTATKQLRALHQQLRSLLGMTCLLDISESHRCSTVFSSCMWAPHGVQKLCIV